MSGLGAVELDRYAETYYLAGADAPADVPIEELQQGLKKRAEAAKSKEDE